MSSEAYKRWAKAENIGLEYSDESIIQVSNLPQDITAEQLVYWMLKFNCKIDISQVEVPDDGKTWSQIFVR